MNLGQDKKIDDGGPVYPTPSEQIADPFDNDKQLLITATPGMSLRDKFALEAMMAFIAGGRTDSGEIADMSYRTADAMLKRRKR